MNREALSALRDAVRAGEIPAHDLDAFIPVFGLTTQGNDAHMAYRGKLDAAKALHEAVLPGWECMMKLMAPCWVDTWKCGDAETTNRPLRGSAADPARAWLLAILEALIAETPHD